MRDLKSTPDLLEIFVEGEGPPNRWRLGMICYSAYLLSTVLGLASYNPIYSLLCRYRKDHLTFSRKSIASGIDSFPSTQWWCIRRQVPLSLTPGFGSGSGLSPVLGLPTDFGNERTSTRRSLIIDFHLYSYARFQLYQWLRPLSRSLALKHKSQLS